MHAPDSSHHWKYPIKFSQNNVVEDKDISFCILSSKIIYPHLQSFVWLYFSTELGLQVDLTIEEHNKEGICYHA